MGREAQVMKERVCKACKEVFFATAQTVVEHSRLCVRAARIGLVLPPTVHERPRKPRLG